MFLWSYVSGLTVTVHETVTSRGLESNFQLDQDPGGASATRKPSVIVSFVMSF